MTDPARVELVARALCREHWGEPDDDLGDLPAWHTYAYDAEIAVRALDAHDAPWTGVIPADEVFRVLGDPRKSVSIQTGDPMRDIIDAHDAGKKGEG